VASRQIKGIDESIFSVHSCWKYRCFCATRSPLAGVWPLFTSSALPFSSLPVCPRPLVDFEAKNICAVI
jgi:hypothetical protein